MEVLQQAFSLSVLPQTVYKLSTFAFQLTLSAFKTLYPGTLNGCAQYCKEEEMSSHEPAVLTYFCSNAFKNPMLILHTSPLYEQKLLLSSGGL